ncbi:Nitric oxide-responding transcriptional regulator Dnr (Crp/Fnr family) [hydrothermal vent metagenome]|uniref:Nitric oxide-responding transcriptional regulator Dnr (Crp/Fnr family) n=1 Tax=hydrothermal vent metagenome TaxID=652676 RepID=A0A1W1ELE6_9ZZZZ
MKKYFKLLLILSISISNLLSQDIKSDIEAINIAGKQRMLTQKMLKSYAMVGMNNKFGNPLLALQNGIKNFDDGLKLLSKFNKDSKIKSELSLSKELWSKSKKTLQEKPSLKVVKRLKENLDKLLLSSDKIVTLLISKTKEKSSDIINIAGKERMYSQKLASLYMLKVWGIEDKKFDEKMKDTLNSFKIALDKLEKYPKNTKEIKKLLKSSKKAFLFFEIMSKSNSKFIPSLIYKKSLEILYNMDKVVSLYTEIEKK